jgi:membrane protease subunit HflC
MKRSPITLITGILLGFIFLCFLFAYQVRETEIVVVTRFGKIVGTKDTPGLKLRLPYPIHQVYAYDKRVHSFERKFEQTTTADARNLLVTVFIGWKIADAEMFHQRFDDGNIKVAEQSLENLVRDTKNGVLGSHPFAHLISPNPADLKFDEIEAEMLASIKPLALDKYGIDVSILGIKQLGLPESITTSVFDRMRQERQKEVDFFNGEGEAEARKIRTEADGKRDELLAKAQGEAQRIIGQAEKEASKHYEVFEENPDLAKLLFKTDALIKSSANRTTWIIDENTAPFDLLTKPSGKNE